MAKAQHATCHAASSIAPFAPAHSATTKMNLNKSCARARKYLNCGRRSARRPSALSERSPAVRLQDKMKSMLVNGFLGGRARWGPPPPMVRTPAPTACTTSSQTKIYDEQSVQKPFMLMLTYKNKGRNVASARVYFHRGIKKRVHLQGQSVPITN